MRRLREMFPSGRGKGAATHICDHPTHYNYTGNSNALYYYKPNSALYSGLDLHVRGITDTDPDVHRVSVVAPEYDFTTHTAITTGDVELVGGNYQLKFLIQPK